MTTELMMILSKLNNLPNFIDRINCYKQAFSLDGNIQGSILKVINASWTVRFIKDVFESFENEDEGQWIFEQFILIFDEFGLGIDFSSRSVISIHERLVHWLQREGSLLVKNCLKKQIEFSSIKAIRAWGVSIRLFGFQAIQSSDRTNACASVFPLAIRSTNMNIVREAFRSWKILVAVFASDPNWRLIVSSQEKGTKVVNRLELILKALQYKELPEISDEVFDCWWFCCISLEMRLAVHFELVAHGLLRYCVGGQTEYLSTSEQLSTIVQRISSPLGAKLVSQSNSKLDENKYSQTTLIEIPQLLPRLLDVLDSLISESPKLYNSKPCVFDNHEVLCGHSVYVMQCIRFCDVRCDRSKIVNFNDRITTLFITLFNNILKIQYDSKVDRSTQLVLFFAQFTAWAQETAMQFEALQDCISRIKRRNPFSQLEPSHKIYIIQFKDGLEKILNMNQFRDFSDSNGFSQMIDNSRLNCSQDSQQFAPSFLFGSQQPVRRSFTSRTGEHSSPGILRKRELSIGTGKSVHWSPVLVRSRSKSPNALKLQPYSGGKSSTSLWNGPPLRSLNQDVIGPPSKISRLEPSHSEQFNTQSDGDRQVEMDEFNSEQTCAGNDLCWVTVFGFSADHRDDILELFSRHGDVMTQRSTNNGNWMHIRYSSPVHARQALAKNATIFHNQMIGVVPYKEECDALKTQKTKMPYTDSTSFNESGTINESCTIV